MRMPGGLAVTSCRGDPSPAQGALRDRWLDAYLASTIRLKPPNNLTAESSSIIKSTAPKRQLGTEARASLFARFSNPLKNINLATPAS